MPQNMMFHWGQQRWHASLSSIGHVCVCQGMDFSERKHVMNEGGNEGGSNSAPRRDFQGLRREKKRG